MYYLKLLAATILAIVSWLVIVFFGAFYGWWMSAVVASGGSDEFFEYASNRLQMENPGNGALVLIEAGNLLHEYYSSSPDSIDRDTVFLTASMSKWFAAYGVMKLVQEGRADLDAPVSRYLTRWQLPAGEFDNDQVTLRTLLSHTAGLADGLGFGDYGADETLPALEQSLANPRSSSGQEVVLEVSSPPGSEWLYSGGGYLILELLIEEISGQSFADYMRSAVFEPLEMNRSNYDHMAIMENNAGSYDRDGNAAPVFQYASKAATAFVTSPADLTKFVLAQMPQTGREAPLNEASIQQMRQAHGRTAGIDIWGLGTILYAPTETGDTLFGHDGANDPAINTTARINLDTGDGLIVLVTGHPALATSIGSDWVLWQTGIPDVLDSDRVIRSMYLPGLAGTLFVLLTALFLAYRRTNLRKTISN